MDDFTSKLKDAFTFGKDRKFKGTANKLGTSEESNIKPNNRQNARVDLLREQKEAASGQPSSSNSRLLSAAPKPSRPTAPPVDRRLPSPLDEPVRSPLPEPRSAPPPSDISVDTMDDIAQNLGLILSSENAQASCDILKKLLGNIMNQPTEPKFRSIRLVNPKIEQAIVFTPGALDLLKTIGFQSSPDGGMVSLPISSGLAPLSQALHYLQAQTPSLSPTPTIASAPAPTPPPVPAPIQSQPVPLPAKPLPPTTHVASTPTPTPIPAPPKEPATLAPLPISDPPTTAPPLVPAAPAPAAPVAPVAAPAAAPPAAPLAVVAESSTSRAAAAAPADAPPPITHPEPTATSSTPAPAAAKPLPAASLRETQVFMPVSPETQVPDWFFERTPNDVRAEYLTLMKRRESDKQLMTRAQREAADRAASKRPRGPAPASVRVRTPEGVCIQSLFHLNEPVAAVFEWVEGSLRHRGMEYELVGPSRKKLQPQGTVREADLAPSVLLNLRVLCGGMEGVPLLSDEMLMKAEVTWAGEGGN